MALVAFDLDDTLFPEIEFVRSAYRAIASRYGLHLLHAMLAAPTPRDAFDSTGLPADVVLGLYRSHRPDIRLPWQSLHTLALLHNSGHHTAIVTDGRAVTQQNKIDALGLGRFVAPEDVFISESFGHLKTDGEAFRALMLRYPGEAYVYVGDNPDKDFKVPRELGWRTVCLLDAGQNIHPQRLAERNPDELSDFTVRSLTEIPDLVSRAGV